VFGLGKKRGYHLRPESDPCRKHLQGAAISTEGRVENSIQKPQETGICRGSRCGDTFLFTGDTGVFNSGLALARQVLYSLSLTPSPFYFSYFSGSVSWFSPGWPMTTVFLFMLPIHLR
jgi:hypothetical protein